MKKALVLLLCLSLTVFAGCSKTDNKNSGGNNTPDNAKAGVVNSESTSKQEEKPIDIDLTTLSSTVVYSEVYGMLTNPYSYTGKKVKMQGGFSVYHDVDTGKDYFAVIIADATACCSQGMEFVLAGDYKYPEDYPEIGEYITVTGIFKTYKENGDTYCHLTDAVMEISEPVVQK